MVVDKERHLYNEVCIVLQKTYFDVFSRSRFEGMIIGYGKICLLFLTVKSAVVLISHIEQPRSVVFDEVHYGTICSLYKKGQFHVDDEPPAARMLLCFFLPDHVKGHQHIWKKIGQDFPIDFPVWRVRFLPVLFGILLPISVFHLVLALKFSEYAAVVAAFLIVFDNALTVQSKLFVPDSIILFLQTTSLCLAHHPGTGSMLASFVVVGFAVASHSSSLVVLLLVFGINAHREWKVIVNPDIPLKGAVLKASARIILSVCVPTAIYLFVFWIHFSSLKSSGPHNHLLSSAFQASLSNGLHTYSRDVSYGRHITLRSKSKGCYLTSFAKTYEALYKDGRRSSQQQVVSCVDHRQSHNWWLLSRPREYTYTEDNKLYDGSKIRIVHSRTLKELNTDNVAAPKTPTKQEVSCSLDESDVNPTWKVDVVDSRGYNSWVTLYTVFRLYHCETKSLLSVTGKKMSDGHYEVVSDPDPFEWSHGDGEWVAEEIFLEDFQSSYEFMVPVSLSFWDKLIEVHVLMTTMTKSTADHRYASSPFMWPLAQTSIAYWYKPSTGAQVHLTGNPVSWIASVLAGLILGSVLCVWALKMQRQVIVVSKELWDRTVYAFALLGGGWMLHMIWLATADRPLFLYCYLPPLVCKHLLHACAAEIVCVLCHQSVALAYFGVLLSIAYAYEVLLPLSLGLALEDTSQIVHLQWWDTWDLLEY